MAPSPDQVQRLHLVEALGVSPLPVEQVPLVGAALLFRRHVEPALKVQQTLGGRGAREKTFT